MLTVAAGADAGPKPTSSAAGEVTAIGPLPARNDEATSSKEAGWIAVAMRERSTGREFLLLKGGTSVWTAKARF